MQTKKNKKAAGKVKDLKPKKDAKGGTGGDGAGKIKVNEFSIHP